MQPIHVFCVTLALRLFQSTVVCTSFSPDEYWQSLEVAHRLVFGTGVLTWEWRDDARIRGFAHPLLFALLYKALALTQLDSTWLVETGVCICEERHSQHTAH